VWCAGRIEGPGCPKGVWCVPVVCFVCPGCVSDGSGLAGPVSWLCDSCVLSGMSCAVGGGEMDLGVETVGALAVEVHSPRGLFDCHRGARWGGWLSSTILQVL